MRTFIEGSSGWGVTGGGAKEDGGLRIWQSVCTKERLLRKHKRPAVRC